MPTEPLKGLFVIGGGTEPELMAAFETVISMFTEGSFGGLDSAAVGRAAAWLVSKYPVEQKP